MITSRARVAGCVLWLTLAGCSDTSIPAAPATSESSAPDPDRLITLQGVGPFKLDMSLEEFKNITHAKVTETMDCGDNPLKIEGAPKGLDFSFTYRNTLNVVEITGETYVTEKGAHVGTAVARLKELYGATLQPQLLFGDTPADARQYGVGARDEPGALLFFIKDGRVSRIWITHQVEPIHDGC